MSVDCRAVNTVVATQVAPRQDLYVARFSQPGPLSVTSSVGSGIVIYDVPPDSPPPGSYIGQIVINLSTPGSSNTVVAITVNDALLDTITLGNGIKQRAKAYTTPLWTFSWSRGNPVIDRLKAAITTAGTSASAIGIDIYCFNGGHNPPYTTV